MSLKSLIAAGPVKRDLVFGSYTGTVVEASYAKAQKSANFRTQVKVRVSEPAEFAGSLTNLYINQGKDDASTVRNLRPWVAILTAAGIPEDSFLPPDEDDVQEVLQLMSAKILKALRQGVTIKLGFDIKDSGNPESPWKNAYPVDAVTAEPAPVVTPTASELAAFAAASAQPVTEGF